MIRITMFGRPCRIQRLNSPQCWWEFYDDPYNSTIKVFDTEDQGKDFFDKIRNGQLADYTQTNLYKILPSLHAELSKVFNINFNSIEVPTKLAYESSDLWKAPVHMHNQYLAWWLNTPAEPEYGYHWYAVDAGQADWGYCPHVGSCFNAIFKISGVK